MHFQKASRPARPAVDACWLHDDVARFVPNLVCLKAVRAAAGHGHGYHLPNGRSGLLCRAEGLLSDIHVPAKETSMPPASITLDASQTSSVRFQSRDLGERSMCTPERAWYAAVQSGRFAQRCRLHLPNRRRQRHHFQSLPHIELPLRELKRLYVGELPDK